MLLQHRILSFILVFIWTISLINATFANNTTVIYHPNGITETITRFPNTAIEETVQNTLPTTTTVVADAQNQTVTIIGRADAMQAANPWISRSEALAAATEAVNNAQSKDPVKVMVTEKIPGATCWCNIGGVRQGSAWESCGSDIPVDQRRYECTVWGGLSGFQEMFREITRWVVYITMLLWVFAIAGVGIMMAYTGSSDEWGAKAAKKWAINIVVGLVILFTFRYILWFIAPWIFG